MPPSGASTIRYRDRVDTPASADTRRSYQFAARSARCGRRCAGTAQRRRGSASPAAIGNGQRSGPARRMPEMTTEPARRSRRTRKSEPCQPAGEDRSGGAAAPPPPASCVVAASTEAGDLLHAHDRRLERGHAPPRCGGGCSQPPRSRHRPRARWRQHHGEQRAQRLIE